MAYHPRTAALLVHPLIALCLACAPSPLVAQQRSPQDIVVQGRRAQPSSWSEAETSHVIVLSDGSKAELVRIARNLETLYWLLSGLTGRTGQSDETVKLRVTMIRDQARFDALGLASSPRWQQGPFASAFPASRYYDPREDGAVMAVPRADQKIVLERGINPLMLQGLAVPGLTLDNPSMPPATNALLDLANTPEVPLPNEVSVPVTAESLLYAGFAQHYLLTFFPAAYPRWYVDGFGELFSTVHFPKPGAIEYGRAPEGTYQIFQRFRGFPLKEVLDGEYLGRARQRTRWTPVHAWVLTHYLFFSDERRPQLRAYLAALARAAPPEQAAAAFGDLGTLAREVRAYHRARKPFDRVNFPVDGTEEPSIRELPKPQAMFVEARLTVGSGADIPPPPPPGTDPAQAASMIKARERALKDRDRRLAELRHDVAVFGSEVEAQLLLAKAECESGHAAECLAAADRALALAPDRSAALAWKGIAETKLAAAGPEGRRDAAILAARATIGRANHADTEAVLPLVAYADSFAAAGQTPTALATDGLAKALTSVPDSPGLRVKLATSLAARGERDAALKALIPVAQGPYDSPERTSAEALFRELNAAQEGGEAGR